MNSKAPDDAKGDWEGARFSVEIYPAASGPVEIVNVVLRGKTAASEPIFAVLTERLAGSQPLREKRDGLYLTGLISIWLSKGRCPG